MDDLGRIRVELETARRDGVQFEAAWRSALSPLPAVTSLPRDERCTEQEIVSWALGATALEWRAAYEGLPAPPAVAAAARMAPPA